MPQTFTNLHGGPITDPNLWERMTMGSQQINPVLRGVLGGLPYGVGPIYTGVSLINKLAHWLTPQTGAPSGGPAPSSASATPPPDSTGDPFDPNNPLGFKLTAPGDATSPAAPTQSQSATPGYYMPGIAAMWNSQRPAFDPTYQQMINPGSAIGPLSGQTAISYRNDLGLGTANPYIAGIPGEAATNTASIYRKNLI